MTGMRSLQQAVNAKLRVVKHLPPDGDLSLIVLKGHLLVEELLFILVRSAVKYTEAISAANLSFYNLASIAKALFYEGHLGPVWDAIFELNTLRNTLAHNLEPPDLEKKLRCFGQVGSGGHAVAGNLVLSDPQSVIGNSIAVICGVLIDFISRSSEGTPNAD